VQAFQDRAGRQFFGSNEEVVTQLVNAVDRIPLAVTLLAQLTRRGNTPSSLLDRWHREHSALLQTHEVGRMNSLATSIQISLAMMDAVDESQEALHLLSICSMLPDGLRPSVFEMLRPEFTNIDRARDTLSAYALADPGIDCVLKTLSPVRHFILERYPAETAHRSLLVSIYFDIVSGLPTLLDEHFQKLSEAAAPEMNNLSSLLLTLVNRPSERLAEAVVRFTEFTTHGQPTATVACALSPHLGQYPQWRARCETAIGTIQCALGEFELSIRSMTAAAKLHLELNNQITAAWCTRQAGHGYIYLGQYDMAQKLLNEAHAIDAEVANHLGLADSRQTFAGFHKAKGDFEGAVQHALVAKETFTSCRVPDRAAQCSHLLAGLYQALGDTSSAAVEFEIALSTFVTVGDMHNVAQTKLALASVRRSQWDFAKAEQLVKEAEVHFKAVGRRYELAQCASELGQLRWAQFRHQEAHVHLSDAIRLYGEVGAARQAEQYQQVLVMVDSSLYLCAYIVSRLVILPCLMISIFRVTVH